MEDVEADNAAGSKSDFGGPIKEASSGTEEEDEHLIYDRTCFRRDKVWRH